MCVCVWSHFTEFSQWHLYIYYYSYFRDLEGKVYRLRMAKSVAQVHTTSCNGARNCSVFLKPELFTTKIQINLRMLYLFYIVLTFLPQIWLQYIMIYTEWYIYSLMIVQTIIQLHLKKDALLKDSELLFKKFFKKCFQLQLHCFSHTIFSVHILMILFSSNLSWHLFFSLWNP